MKRRGSLTMDLIFSITTILMISSVCVVSTRNIIFLEQKVEEKKAMEEKISEEADREVIKNKSKKSDEILDSSIEKYSSGKYRLEIKRDIKDKKYGLVKSDISVRLKCLERNVSVYSILDTGDINEE